ncbi:MAG: hypothetical protein JSR59_19990 [Proteobacteria bacterium]|nr:hypothetical protein [Pseudomonadota bacterium]
MILKFGLSFEYRIAGQFRSIRSESSTKNERIESRLQGTGPAPKRGGRTTLPMNLRRRPGAGPSLVEESAAAAASLRQQAQQLVQAVSTFKLSHPAS